MITPKALGTLDRGICVVRRRAGAGAVAEALGAAELGEALGMHPV